MYDMILLKGVAVRVVYRQMYRASKSIVLLVILFLLTDACSKRSEIEDFPFLDTTLNMEERVNLLVSQMTLEEKVSQMMNDAPAIERLGIPKYNWWPEGLPGVAR